MVLPAMADRRALSFPYSIDIDGMTCSSCVAAVEQAGYGASMK